MLLYHIADPPVTSRCDGAQRGERDIPLGKGGYGGAEVGGYTKYNMVDRCIDQHVIWIFNHRNNMNGGANGQQRY